MQDLNKVRKLHRSLNKLCNLLDYYYDINNGGCCYISYLISKWLNRFKINYKLVVYDNKNKNIKKVYEEITNMKVNSLENCSISGGNTCCHYCIYIDNIGYVNKGDTKGLRKYVLRNKISPRSIYWIYKNSKWNPYYNTNYNKLMRIKIDSFFKGYES